MKVLITGSSGLVGNSIKKSDKKSDIEFIYWSSKDCNLLNYEEVYNKLIELQPDIIVNLAANVGGLFKNLNKNVEMFEDNIQMNMNILRLSKKIGVKMVISCLSTCIFPDKTEYPIKEEYLNNGIPHYSNNGYAYAKRFIDIYTGLMNVENSETLFVNLSPTNIYGENDNYNLNDAHVIPALIHRGYLSSGGEFEIKGSGKALRMFIYSDDLAKIILEFINFYAEDKLNKMKDLINITRENQLNYNFIVADKDEITIKYIAEIIAEQFNINKLTFNTNYPDGQYRKPVDNTRLKELFKLYNKNLEFVDFKEKLIETCNYFKNNYNNIRK